MNKNNKEKASRALTESSTETVAASWLRRRVLERSIYRALEGLILAGISLFIISLLTLATVMMVSLMELRPGKTPLNASWVRIVFGCFLCNLAISFLAVRGRIFGGNHPYPKPVTLTPVFPGTGTLLIRLAIEVIASGASLLMSASESFEALLRLLRSEPDELAPFIAWLWDKQTKATFSEISFKFRQLNIVRVLTQLREMSAIVWLPDPHGVILLSEELQKELGRVFGHKTPPQPEAPSEDPRHSAPEEEMYSAEDADSEILQSYKTLGLPPFSPIDQVKKNYRQLAKVYHPDALAGRGRNHGASSDEKMKLINAAYERILRRLE